MATLNVSEDVEKLEVIFFPSESIKLYNLKKIFRVPYKVKLHQCCYPEIPLLGNSPKEIKTYVLKKSSYTFSQEKSRETKYDTFSWLNTAQK